MGLKEIKAAGKKAAHLIEIGIEINRIENVWGPKYDTLRAAAGKDLKDLKDAEVKALMHEGLDVDATTMTNTKKVLVAVENMILGIRQIKDTLPANDIGAEAG